MTIDLFKSIIEKIKSETAVPDVQLFNWGEPLLHPEIDRFVRIVANHGMSSALSSNLNVDAKSLEQAISADPTYFRISASGTRPETYETTHRRGKVERLIENMHLLRTYADKHKAGTEITVAYHIYKNNASTDLIRMAELCAKLKYKLVPAWAYLMPLEKNFDYIAGTADQDTLDIVDKLAVDPRAHQRIAMPFRSQSCELQNAQTAINHDGSVALCCTVYDPAYTIAHNFLEHSHDELQGLKLAHPLCATCMEGAFHVIATYGVSKQLDQLGNASIRQNGSPYRIKGEHPLLLQGGKLVVVVQQKPAYVRARKRAKRFMRRASGLLRQAKI